MIFQVTNGDSPSIKPMIYADLDLIAFMVLNIHGQTLSIPAARVLWIVQRFETDHVPKSISGEPCESPWSDW